MRTKFNPFPTLTTERLTLRQLSLGDKEDIFALRSDPEVNKFLGRTPSKTIDDAINFINIIDENIKQNNSLYWVITLSKTHEVVGTICLYDFSEENSSCEIGYELLTKFQGQGIMMEAAKEVLNYAFQSLLFQKIIAFTHKENLGSTKLLSKLNFLLSPETDQENLDFCIFTLTLRA